MPNPSRAAVLPSYVLHMFSTEDGRPLRMQMDDFWYEAPPGEPIEITEGPFYADKLVEHYGPVYGLIHVSGMRTRTGFAVDTESAIKEATARLREVETDLLLRWVKDQQEDRLKAGLPALPPTGRVEKIIRDNHIDLKRRFGFSPAAWDGADDRAATTSHAEEQLRKVIAEKNEEIERLKSDHDTSSTRLARLEAALGLADDHDQDQE